MGWMRTLLLGDIGNRLDMADAEKEIDGLRRSLRRRWERDQSQDQLIRELQKENEQLELCLAALIRSLEHKGILTPTEVAKLVNLIDDDEDEALKAT